MRNAILHGLVTAALAALAAIIFANVYSAALAVDFSMVANPVGIIASCTIGGLLASLGYHFFRKWVKRGTDGWFNAIFTVLTFASIGPVFGATLPLTVEAPELFVGMVAPMHLFPQLFWLVSKPFFSAP